MLKVRPVKLSDLFAKVIDDKRELNKLKITQEVFTYLTKIDSSIRKVIKISDSFDVTKKSNNSLYYTTVFLYAFEGHYVASINCITYLIVLYGHDIFDPLRGRYAHRLKEIEKIDVEGKFKFLEDHGFDDIIYRDFQTLRNKIAHNDFEVDNESTMIRVAEKKYDIAQNMAALLAVSANLVQQLESLINEIGEDKCKGK